MTSNPYHVILANKQNVYTLIDLLAYICSLSVYRIEQREEEDLSNPNNKKKKIGFKLGRGSEVFMERILNCMTRGS